MKLDYKKFLKALGWIASILLVIILLLNLVGKFFIREISQTIFGETEFVQSVAILEPTELLGLDKPAPYFELQNLKGKLIKLSDFKGFPLVILFWSSWNQPSQMEFGIIDAMQKDDNFFKMIAINNQEGRDFVSNFIKRGSYSGTDVLLDVNGMVGDVYEARNLPAFYFIDKDGILRDFYYGPLSEIEIVDKIGKFAN